MTDKALIFNIQKFSLHDGPGIRTTVFFKGCPLICLWCHNVESQGFGKEPMLRSDLCSGCASCVERCPSSAVALAGGEARTDPALCNRCGKCVIFCPRNLRRIVGEEKSVAELLAEVLKDRVFYERSGGGITASGGEAMAQIGALAELLAACRKEGLHTVVDTSGQAPWSSFERIITLTDLFLYDLKLMDEEAHRKFTGFSNSAILENLARLSEATDAIWIRFPVIPGLNDGPENMEKTFAFLKKIRFRQINLLPYHGLGRSKSGRLGREDLLEGVEPPDGERMEEIRKLFTDAGFEAFIGG